MLKRNKKVDHGRSENLIKKSEYIKKLELQVMVLYRILNSKTASKEENRNSQDNPDSNSVKQ